MTPRVSCWRRIHRIDHGLGVLAICTGCPNVRCRRWQSMPIHELNSPSQWAHLKPNDIGNCFLPTGFPWPAPRRILWMAFNLMLQFSARGWNSDAHDPTAWFCCNFFKIETKHNTKRLRTAPCIAMNGSVAWLCYILCMHPGWFKFHILNENTDQNVRSLTLNRN